MKTTTITIDFWQTLYDSENGEARNQKRREGLIEAITTEIGSAPDRELFDEAYRGLWDFFDHHWLGSQRTPTSTEMIEEMLRRLDCTLSEERRAEVVRIYEEGILEHPPGLLPGVREGLDYLSSFAKLALISDTAFSPGSVLRRLMERDGILHHFTGFVFSDETGVAKPHPTAFMTALEQIGGEPETSIHIGDIERTDIVGAKGVGMTAILYRSSAHLHKYAEAETAADTIMEDWSEIAQHVS